MNQKFSIELRSIDTIRPYEKNPRQNDDAVDAVAASLQQFGWRQPIVVDGEGVIICGHTRLKAAKKLGLSKVPVHVANDLSPEQVKALRIADNKTSDLSDWDYDILPIELSELRDGGFDLSLLAFDEDELDKLLNTEPAQGLTDDDAIPEPPKEAITQPGDLWLLGAYTVCPHCKERNDVEE
jgi:ParB-like chromosome segregation protein Spo0J